MRFEIFQTDVFPLSETGFFSHLTPITSHLDLSSFSATNPFLSFPRRRPINGSVDRFVPDHAAGGGAGAHDLAAFGAADAALFFFHAALPQDIPGEIGIGENRAAEPGEIEAARKIAHGWYNGNAEYFVRHRTVFENIMPDYEYIGKRRHHSGRDFCGWGALAPVAIPAEWK